MPVAIEENNGAAGRGSAAAQPGATLESPAARGELPLTLLSAGYHLRQINAIRAHLGGHAERVALPMVLWLGEQVADPCPEVAHAAAAAMDSLTLETQARRGTYSLREIEIATGIPRETLRRTARQFERFGWMKSQTGTALAVTPQFKDFLLSDLESERLADFRWTAARVRELSDPATADIGATPLQALAAMRACRSIELPVSIRWAIPPPPARHCSAAAGIYVCGYNLRHLLRLAPFFDGDLTQCVLLGEIGHRNIAALARGATKPEDSVATALKLAQPDENLLNDPRRAFNAYSLALCLDVPYETTRRKLAQLSDRGYVTRDQDGLYWVQPDVGDVFLSFNRERRADMLATAEMIESLLQTPERCLLTHGGPNACFRSADETTGRAASQVGTRTGDHHSGTSS